MEQINKIEIVGLVGSVRSNMVSGNLVVNFTVATTAAYKGRDGSAIMDTTWFDVAAWEGKGMPDLSRSQKGSPVQVFGRIRMKSYTTSAGIERVEPEVRAQRVVLLDPDINLSPSM